MTSRLETAGAQGILGLFTELVAPGGVQEANRHSAASLVQCARRRGWNARFLSLNDPSGECALCFDDTEFSFRGFQRAKGAFTLAAIRGAQELVRGGGCIVLAGHPNLAPAWPASSQPLAEPRGFDRVEPAFGARISRMAVVFCDSRRVSRAHASRDALVRVAAPGRARGQDSYTVATGDSLLSRYDRLRPAFLARPFIAFRWRLR